MGSGGGDGLAARLAACTSRIEELGEQLAQELTRRNQLIVEARDHDGASLGTIAHWARVSRTTINRVLSAN